VVQTPINSPDWVHLLSAGEISTGDNHRPYRVQDTDTLQGADRGVFGRTDSDGRAEN